MSYQLHITLTAEKDMAHAVNYIEFVLKNPQAANQLLDEAERRINALVQFPEKSPLVHDRLLASWGIRFIRVRNYLAFYVISQEKQNITIVRFLYEKSNWMTILSSGFSLS